MSLREHDGLAGLPGGELVAQGLRDLGAGRETIEALVVGVAGARLRAVGLDIPAVRVERASHRLYDRLAQVDARTAHGRYNALIRRLASFARAAEHARAS